MVGLSMGQECYASDYFDQLYRWAESLLTRVAYVDSQTSEQLPNKKEHQHNRETVPFESTSSRKPRRFFKK